MKYCIMHIPSAYYVYLDNLRGTVESDLDTTQTISTEHTNYSRLLFKSKEVAYDYLQDMLCYYVNTKCGFIFLHPIEYMGLPRVQSHLFEVVEVM